MRLYSVMGTVLSTFIDLQRKENIVINSHVDASAQSRFRGRDKSRPGAMCRAQRRRIETVSRAAAKLSCRAVVMSGLGVA